MSNRAERRRGDVMRNGGVPDLSHLAGAVQVAPPGATAKVGASGGVIIWHLDENGLCEVPIQNTPQGPRTVWRRDQYVTGEDLLVAIQEIVRAVVREEIAALNHYHEIAADDVLPRVVETGPPVAYAVEDQLPRIRFTDTGEVVSMADVRRAWDAWQVNEEPTDG